VNYVFKNLRELAQHLTGLGEQQKALAAKHDMSRTVQWYSAMTVQWYSATSEAYLDAASVVARTIVEDIALYDEYRVAYAEAQVQLAGTFWQLLKAGGVAVAAYGVDKGWAAP
jgi:hypothetical protein